MKLIICDIDGVVLDHTGRDRLIPPKHVQHLNSSWHIHQDAINHYPDPPLQENIKLLQAMLTENDGVIFLTSRMHLAHKGTKRDMQNIGLDSKKLFGLVFRADDDNAPPDKFKATMVKKILMTLITMGHEIDELVFIDDCANNIDAVSRWRDVYPVQNLKIYHVEGHGKWILKD